MSWTLHALVVASATADSDELMRTLAVRAERRPTVYTLVVPMPGAGSVAREDATRRLAAALERARTLGLQMDGVVGDGDPVVAVCETYDPRRFDEIIVSTLPRHASHWTRIGLPRRIARATGARAIQIESGTGHPAPPGTPAHRPSLARRGVLAALTPLTWGRRRGEQRSERGADALTRES